MTNNFGERGPLGKGPFDKAGTYAVARLEKETGDRVIGDRYSDCEEAKAMAAKIDACTAIIDRKHNWLDTMGRVDVDARQLRADGYLKSGQLDKALADLDELQNIIPDYSTGPSLLAPAIRDPQS